jgi:hypothetical protein
MEKYLSKRHRHESKGKVDGILFELSGIHQLGQGNQEFRKGKFDEQGTALLFP